MAVLKIQFRKGDDWVKTPKWYAEFQFAGKKHRVPYSKSKSDTATFLANVEELAGKRRTKKEPSEELLSWFKNQEPEVLAKLERIGLWESEAASKRLAEHLGDFEAAVKANGAAPEQARLVRYRAERVLVEAGCKTLDCLKPSKTRDVRTIILTAINDLKAKSKRFSVQTKKFYLAAVKQFTAWLVPERLTADPLVRLKISEAADPVHERRALTIAEATALLEATAAAPERWGMTGPERALLYRLALETGLRAGELRSLTRASFNLDSDPPVVFLAGKFTKNGDPATQPLNDDLVGPLKAHLKDKLPGAPAFTIPKVHTVRMFKSDLKAAGIEYRDDSGRVADFHSLRHTFITNLARAGVHPSVAQELARHSSITLTMNHYTHTVLKDKALALAKLPKLTDKGAKESGKGAG